MTTTPIPPAFARATLLLLPDRDGYLALMPMDEPGVECPSCKTGRAMGLAVLRQEMPSGTWCFRCLFCDAQEPATVAMEKMNG